MKVFQVNKDIIINPDNICAVTISNTTTGVSVDVNLVSGKDICLVFYYHGNDSFPFLKAQAYLQILLSLLWSVDADYIDGQSIINQANRDYRLMGEENKS